MTEWGRGNIRRNNDWEFSKITKEIKAQIQEAQRILSRINTTHTHACMHACTHTLHILYLNHWKPKIKRTSWWQEAWGQGGDTWHTEKQRWNKLIRNYTKEKNNRMTSLKLLKEYFKTTVNLEFYIQRKCPSEMKTSNKQNRREFINSKLEL